MRKKLLLAILFALLLTSCSFNLKMDKTQKIVELNWLFTQSKPAQVVVTK